MSVLMTMITNAMKDVNDETKSLMVDAIRIAAIHYQQNAQEIIGMEQDASTPVATQLIGLRSMFNEQARKCRMIADAIEKARQS